MPTEITPPMYTMLVEEIQWALDEKEPYNFTHYLIWSKIYHEVQPQVDDEDDEDEGEEEKRPKKKPKAAKRGKEEVFYFHPEDEVLQKHAIAHGSFAYETRSAEEAGDARKAFSDLGIKPMGHLILIDAAQFTKAVKALTDFVGPAS